MGMVMVRLHQIFVVPVALIPRFDASFRARIRSVLLVLSGACHADVQEE